MVRLTIPQKLMGCFTALLLLTLVLALYSLRTLDTVRAVSERATAQSARALELVGEINTHLANARFAQRGVILYSMAHDATEADGQRVRFQKEAGGIRAALTAIRPLLSDAGRARSIDSFSSALNDYSELAGQLIAAAAAGQTATSIEILKVRSKPVGAAMEKIATELAAYEKTEMEESRTTLNKAVARSKGIDAVLLLLAVGLGAVVFFVVRQVTAVLLTTARGLAEVSEQVHDAADQIARSGTSLAAGASQQASSLEETSASSHELSTMTRKGADHASAAAQNVTESHRQAQLALQSLEHMVSSMQRMDESSSKISRIIKVIDEIAFQTNILALNAAVEAARAGAAGAGFAVVADEVRNLAQRCAEAARETTGLIEDTVGSTRDSLVRVDQVAQAIRDIAATSTTIKSLVDEVSSSNQEQSQGIDQIAHAIIQMEDVTQTLAANAEESAASSQEMFAQMGILRQMAQGLHALVEA